MNNIQSIIRQREQAIIEQQRRKEERRIIEGFAVNGQIAAAGMNSTINKLQIERALQIAKTPRHLVIANAATAAAIRKQFTREEVEIIITSAVETGTAYVVTDEELKQQLLGSIEKRGY